MTTYNDSDHYTYVNVCQDCYMAHHGIGTSANLDNELHLLSDGRLTDATCTDHDGGHTYGPHDDDREPAVCTRCGSDKTHNGIFTFRWWPCEGCGSTLGGARYRLAYWFDGFTSEDDMPIDLVPNH